MFKRTGMSIAQLKTFFSFDEDKFNNIDVLIDLLNKQKTQLDKQINELTRDMEHVDKKLLYYINIKEALTMNKAIPDGSNFKD